MRERNVGRQENPIRAEKPSPRRAWEARPVKEYEARSRNYPAQFRWRHRAGHNSGVCKRTRFRTIAGGNDEHPGKAVVIDPCLPFGSAVQQTAQDTPKE
jgi:hypothetical protein